MITIVPYDSAWPDEFLRAKTVLLTLLRDRILAIEHTGSTSVPGLAAKPIIDMCATTKDLIAFRGLDSELLSIGYEFEDYGAANRLFYVKRSGAGERTHHLHIFPVESWPLLKERMFAEHLRKYPEAAKRYGELKYRLAEHGLDREEYTRRKTELIQELMDAARAERGLPSEPVW